MRVVAVCVASKESLEALSPVSAEVCMCFQVTGAGAGMACEEVKADDGMLELGSDIWASCGEVTRAGVQLDGSIGRV